MACSLATVDVAPCGLVYNSSRKQLESLLLLLCAAVNKIDVEFSCGNWTTLLVTAKTNGLGCTSQGVNRAKAAQIVCDGLNVDCTDLQCMSDADLDALYTYLTCVLVNEINP